MKKIALMFFCMCFSAILCCCVSADEGTYVRLGYVRLINSGTIRITGNIINPVENQTLTIMLCESENGKYIDTQIKYFNQVVPKLGADNSFSYDLKTNYIIEDEKEYVIRIGGENVKLTEEKMLGYELSYGDVDGNYIITANDAALVFAYVLDKSKCPLTDIQLKKAKVSGLEKISASDAACILNKTYDYSYLFPVE